MKAPTAQRQEVILKELKDEGFVSITLLAGRLGVSEMTVRRDLDRLAEAGHLERTHGGAAPLRPLSSQGIDLVEPSLDSRYQAQAAEKNAIARTAAGLVSAGQTIALDIGTTTGRLASELANLPVSIYTTSIRIAALLASARASVYVPGGVVAGIEPSIIGARAVDHLRQLNFDIVFLGASGLSGNGAFFDYSLEDTEIKRALTDVSRKVVMLMDSSKFSRVSVARICDAHKVHTLITDRMPPEPIRGILQDMGTEVLLAK
ncbi:MAG: DeoR/GlpR transcriptional regulator [Rhodobacteraceae bacterium]|nr:DeoR/GlpR transcriptional regulator [Paracoccaceae bacterium]